MEADWTILPQALLQLIATRLTNICDYIRFRAVCVWWRCAVSPTGFIHHQVLPWMILSRFDNPTVSCFNLSDRRIYNFNLPETQGKCLFGSPHGWLVMIEVDTKQQRCQGPPVSLLNFDTRFQITQQRCPGPAVSLLNPVTRAQIRLPPLPLSRLSTTPLSPLSIMYRVVLCSDPSVGSPHHLLVAIWIRHNLLFIRHGDDCWSHVEMGFLATNGDMIYFRESLYFVNWDGRLEVLDAVSSTLSYHGRIYLDSPSNDDEMCPRHRLHLVQAGEDLLLLDWYLKFEGIKNWLSVEGFDIYKLVGRSQFKWIKIEDDTGSPTLLVNNKQSLSLSGYRGGFGENRIYYCTEIRRSTVGVEEIDVVEGHARINSSTEKIYLIHGELSVPQVSWIVPRMC